MDCGKLIGVGRRSSSLERTSSSTNTEKSPLGDQKAVGVVFKGGGIQREPASLCYLLGG
jgi:hypothetical protein